VSAEQKADSTRGSILLQVLDLEDQLQALHFATASCLVEDQEVAGAAACFAPIDPGELRATHRWVF
jgi:hypothetical protein